MSRVVLVALAVLVALGLAEASLRYVYDPLDWLSRPDWEQVLYEQTFHARREWANPNPDPDVKYQWGGSRARLPLPYQTYRRYVRELYQPSDDPILGYGHRPGAVMRLSMAAGDYYDMTIRINSMGLREREIGPKRGRRVLVVGDSIVFGDGVEAEDAFPKVLERRLGVEVLNYGVGGYATRQELELLKTTRALADRPDLVLLVICMNDHVETNEFISWERESGLLTDAVGARAMARWAGARLRLPRLVFAGIQTVRAWARRPDVWEVAHAPGSADYAYDAATEARIAANLAAFRDYVRGHGVRLGLVVSPPEFSLDARHPQHADALRQYQTWLRLARATGVPVLDLRAAFLARQDEWTAGRISRSLYHEWDSGHLNPRGHRLAAEAIAHWLPEAFDWR